MGKTIVRINAIRQSVKRTVGHNKTVERIGQVSIEVDASGIVNELTVVERPVPRLERSGFVEKRRDKRGCARRGSCK